MALQHDSARYPNGMMMYVVLANPGLTINPAQTFVLVLPSFGYNYQLRDLYGLTRTSKLKGVSYLCIRFPRDKMAVTSLLVNCGVKVPTIARINNLCVSSSVYLKGE